jgi:hypothetical protein
VAHFFLTVHVLCGKMSGKPMKPPATKNLCGKMSRKPLTPPTTKNLCGKMSGKPMKPPTTKNGPAAAGFVTQALAAVIFFTCQLHP